MTGPAKQNRGPSFVRGLIPRSSRKRSPTAEARTKKGRFYRPLPKEFRHCGFTYQQIAREGDAAIYEQTWLGCAEPSPSYEVVRIRRRDEFQIAGRFVEPAEVYPASEFWGVDGFIITDKNKAWDKFSEISQEQPARRREVK